jgi:hypothetical protein
MLPAWLALLLAIGGVSALILGASRTGALLLGPAAFQWLLWPLLAPVAGAVPSGYIGAAIPLLLSFGGLLLLGRFVRAIFGKEAAGQMVGTYLVRLFDLIARGLGWMLTAPFRFLFRRRPEP